MSRRGRRPRQSVPKENVEEVESMIERVRTPDAPVRARMLSPGLPDDDDAELAEVIARSRIEFHEEMKRREEAERERARLRVEMAVPLARLRLWRRHSVSRQEQSHLDRVIDAIEERLSGRDDRTTLSPPGYDEFVGSLRSSAVFRPVVELLLSTPRA